VAALYNGMVRVRPGNAEVAEALESTCSQPDWPAT
jgi:hypothetical protein